MADRDRASKRPPADALSAAIDAAQRDPSNAAHWDLVEEIVDTAQRPSDVRELFRSVLGKKSLEPEIASDVGQRAVRFYESWYGDDTRELSELLSRVLELDKEAHWAFERLTVALTVAERWDELLAAYDLAIERADETARRMKLLDEAAQAAKDFASKPDRAIDYMQKLFVLDPDNASLASSLERLLERQGRFRDLIELWGSRIDVQPQKQQRDTRVKMATCHLDLLHDPAAALAEVERVLADAPDYKPAFDLVERVLAKSDAEPAVRKKALEHLKAHFIKGKKPKDVVRVLEAGLQFVAQQEQRALLRELIERSVDLKDDGRAMAHQAALLVAEPMPNERDALRVLAERTRDYERYAAALVAAADGCSEPGTRVDLLLDAARVREDQLGQPDAAIDLYRRVFEAGAAREVTVLAGRKLVQLLEEQKRERETLDVLSRMCELEEQPDVRKSMLGRVAELAEKLGDSQRSQDAWRLRVGQDDSDVEALSALIDNAERAGDDATLAKLLRKRSEAKGAAHKRRADLVRLAGLHAGKLADLDTAIELWRTVCTEYGEDSEAVTALTELLSRAERWSELAEVLQRAASREIERFTDLQTQLGDAYRERLGKPEQAAQRYRSALQVDPAHERARAGAQALLADASCRAVAAEALAEAYAQTGQWQGTLKLLEIRIETADSDPTRAELLVEAAQLQEEHQGDAAAALSSYARAFAYLPDDRVTEREIRRLAESLGKWDAVVKAYADTIASLPPSAARVADLRYQQGLTIEERLGDRAAALDAYAKAAAMCPERLDLASAAVRLSAALGHWDSAAAQLLASAAASPAVLPSLLTTLEAAARETGTWDRLSAALVHAADAQRDLPPALARELYVRVARMEREERKDLDAAQLALSRAVHADPADDATLLALADAQRGRPSTALLDTLERIAARRPDDLDVLTEACEVALSLLGDGSRARKCLGALYDRALGLWRHGKPASGKREPASSLAWATDKLCELNLAAGEARAALELLQSGAALPVPADQKQSWLKQAARLSLAPLGDSARAIGSYREVLAADPRDAEALSRLGELFTASGALPDLLALLRHELGQAPAPERQLELRLQIARVLGELEARGDRIATLRDNLAQEPGHKASLDALGALLRNAGRGAELAEILLAQAHAVRERGRNAEAVALLRELAQLRERELHDKKAAIEAYREVHALEPEGNASEALARLHGSLGDHAAAADWLQVRLGTAPPDTRAVTSVELARAHIEAGQLARAKMCLEQALMLDPKVGEARELLTELYRAEGNHEQLAQLLMQGAALASDRTQRIEYLREASRLLYEALGAPDRAIPALQQAIELLPGDTRLSMMLAEGLHVAKRHDEARTVLRGVIDAFGRRRSPERAEVHFQLARYAEAAGDAQDAFAELDNATKMDVAHQGALHMLARMARDQGDLERAERAYRGLLLLLRRQKNDDVRAVGAGEVFYELHRIAKTQGETGQADELLSSALEAAAHNEVEARRLSRALRERREHELLLRVLDARLQLVRDPELEAEVLAEKAHVLEQDLGKPAEALELLLRSVGLAPEKELAHSAAQALAVRTGDLSRYLDALDAAIDAAHAGRDPDGERLAARLTLRLGRVIERELEDFDRAAGLYGKVEASGHCVADAWLAMARVAGARGDIAEQRRVLARIAEASDASADRATRDEARFLLAELELKQPKLRELGVKTLSAAIESTRDYARAKIVLGRAVADAPDHEGLLALYERTARSSRDESMLVDFIERRAALASATVDDTREGVDVALRIGDAERAERLLKRAAELARKTKAARASWVFSGLADCRLQAGDTRAAIAHLQDAVSVAEPEEIDALLRELAELAAGEGGDLQVAADTYTRLLEAAPSERSLWEPMLGVLTKQKDRKKFEAFVQQTLEVLAPIDDRAVVLLAHASFLTDVLRKEQDAIAVLRRLLDEDSTNLEATDRLLGIYQRQGMNRELADLLRGSFDKARDERNVEAITALGLRLGQLYGAEHAQDACDAYRAALEWEPNHRELLTALLERLPKDADLSERVELELRLLAGETGAAAAKLALRVAGSLAQLGDEVRLLETLEAGHRACPEDDAVRDKLEGLYASGENWSALAGLMMSEAERVGSNMVAVARLKNAAMLYRDKLGDLEGAARALRAALQIVPDDLSLLGELARNLAAAGQHDTAIADVTNLIDSHPGADSGKVDLLRVRAELCIGVQRLADAVEDLEAAYAIAPADVEPALLHALDALTAQTRTEGDLVAERVASLRLFALLTARGDLQAARDVLSTWVSRDPSDVASLRELRALDTRAQRWPDVVRSCLRAIDIEEGQERIEAVLALADAYEQLGRLHDALPALMRVNEDAPGAMALRARLRVVLGTLDMKRELAALLVGDAGLEADLGARAAKLLEAVRLYLAVDDPEAAMPVLASAMELTPGDDQTRLLLVDIQLGLGHVEEAAVIVDQALEAHKRKRSPELALFQLRMGRICALRGDRASQLKWLGTALDTDRKSGEVASEMADVAMLIEDYDTAMKALRTLTMMEDPKPMTRAVAFLRQAQIAVVRGDVTRAQHWARKAKSLDENLAEADEFLARIGG